MGDTSLIITEFNFQQLRKLMAAGAMTKSSVQVYCKNKSLYSKCMAFTGNNKLFNYYSYDNMYKKALRKIINLSKRNKIHEKNNNLWIKSSLFRDVSLDINNIDLKFRYKNIGDVKVIDNKVEISDTFLNAFISWNSKFSISDTYTNWRQEIFLKDAMNRNVENLYILGVLKDGNKNITKHHMNKRKILRREIISAISGQDNNCDLSELRKNFKLNTRSINIVGEKIRYA